MEVGDVMTRGVKTCQAGDALDVAARIMWDNDCGCVPVVDADGKITGMITDRDVCMAAYTQGKPLADIPVETASAHTVYSVRDTSSIDSVLTLMEQHQIRRIPVVDEAGRPVGIVAPSDLIRHTRGVSRHTEALRPDAVVAALAAVSEPAVPHFGAAA